MRNAALVCFLILIPWSLRAQDKMDDWKGLNGLRSGEKIELIETGMKKHVGTFSTVTEEAIQLREGSNDVGIRTMGAGAGAGDAAFRFAPKFSQVLRPFLTEGQAALWLGKHAQAIR
jgi:hypothetical protein